MSLCPLFLNILRRLRKDSPHPPRCRRRYLHRHLYPLSVLILRLRLRLPYPPLPSHAHHLVNKQTNKQNVVAELAKQADDDESALLLGLRQDVLDHVQYLDSFSYNNVFVGEERQILGTKIDFDTPRMGTS